MKPLVSILVSLVSSFITVGLTYHRIPASAQILPDNTLGNEGSVVVPNQTIREIPSERIDGGAIRGENLFHSFQEFNVGEGRGVYFSNPDNISNILTRVTGSNISQILGTLGVLGNANLFLINPNGIVFGPNARLDVGGSFFGSTADGILFENGVEFTATNPQAPPLLTINIPIGLNLRENPGEIVVQGPGHNLRIDPNTGATLRDNRPVGLQVPSGQTLALVGGNISLVGGNLTAEGGQIELGSVATSQVIFSTPEEETFDYDENNGIFGDIQLNQEASVDVSGEGTGSVFVRAERVRLTNGSVLLSLGDGDPGSLSVAATEVELIGTSANGIFPSGLIGSLNPGATGEGGTLEIGAERVTIRDGAQVVASTSGEGDAGDVSVFASQVELVGTSPDGLLSSGLLTAVNPNATGNGGKLEIGTERLIVRDGAQVIASTFGEGDAGNLSVFASQVELIGTSADGLFSSGLFAAVNPNATGNGGTLEIGTERLSVRDGAQVIASTFGEGNAANLTVNATEVELMGTSADGLFPSGLFAEVNPQAVGNGGTVTIAVERLSVRDGALVTASTFGNGNAANLTVNATEVELVGTSVDGQFFSGLFANVGAEAEGNGGNLEINVERLSVRDGAQVLTTTLGQGDAGNLTVKAAQVELRGTSADGQIVSGLFAAADNPNVNVQGGTLDISAEQLTIEDSAQMSVSNIGVGRPGNINVIAADIRLNNEASITAESAVGAGGNITLEAVDVQLRRSRILAVGLGEGLVGDVEIDANFLILLRDSGIITEAFNPTGGRITIVSTDVVRSQNSVIQANGESIGTELGTVEIFETRQIEVSDPESLIAQNPCKQSSESQFVITGRGGLPPNPTQGTRQRGVSISLTEPMESQGRGENRPQQRSEAQSRSVSSRDIVPARGWIRNEKGEVILVSYDPTGIQPQRPMEQARTCHSNSDKYGED